MIFIFAMTECWLNDGEVGGNPATPPQEEMLNCVSS